MATVDTYHQAPPLYWYTTDKRGHIDSYLEEWHSGIRYVGFLERPSSYILTSHKLQFHSLTQRFLQH